MSRYFLYLIGLSVFALLHGLFWQQEGRLLSLRFEDEEDASSKISGLDYEDLKAQIARLEERFDQISGAISVSNNSSISNVAIGHGQGGRRDSLPSCRAIMQQPYSPLANGDFLTQSEVVWNPRHDGSRELNLAHICNLHRYTAAQARQCLAGSHLNLIGDSLTRYQFLSLAHFIHKAEYPRRFGIQKPCLHHDQNQNSQCSKEEEPNICMAGDWRLRAGADSWAAFMEAVGGGSDGGIFDGHMECSCARSANLKCQDGSSTTCAIENELYEGPLLGGKDKNRVVLSYIQENGWGDNPNPIRMFNFSECSFSGSCRRSKNATEYFVQRAQNNDFDVSQPLEEALSGIIRENFPPINITIYNRGLWGALKEERAEMILSQMKDLVGGHPGGRCFFRSTTASPRSGGLARTENEKIKEVAFKQGCDFLDFAHVTSLFAPLQFSGKLPVTRRQLDNSIIWSEMERQTVFWDQVHFMPWVYEELNNLMLNVLCNRDKTI